MKLDARVDGLDALSRALSDIAADDVLKAAVESAATEVRDAVVARLRDGQPPQSASGALAGSLTIDLAGEGLSATVGTPLDYAWQLEFGSRNRPPMPWLEPAFREAQPGILATVKAWLARGSKSSAA
jgi:Bacteriophage HK97-gp10, putative tail-component